MLYVQSGGSIFLASGANTAVIQATPGSPLVIAAFGLGSITPSVASGTVPSSGASSATAMPSVTINGVGAPVLSAAYIGLGIYAITVDVPVTVSSGSDTVVLGGAIGGIGAAGSTGPIGPAGPTGPIGLTGVNGATGGQGPIGPAGATGPIGPAGPTGPTGIQGSAGSQGTQGLTGANGANGSQGSQGSQGPQGAQGAIGSQGIQGLARISGNPGYCGRYWYHRRRGFDMAGKLEFDNPLQFERWRSASRQ